MEQEINEGALTLLDHYVNVTPAGQYSVLITGKWGSGKSFFIDSYIKYLKDEFNIDCIYVSLNGVCSITDVQLQILTEVHPQLFNKYTAGAASLLGRTIKFGLTLTPSEASESTVDVGEGFKWLMEKISFSGKRKGAVIIFDDVERCSVQLDTVLGYVSNLIHSGQSKIICICAENELQGDKKKYFAKAKEKVFGITTRIQPDQESALQKFTQDIRTEEIQQFVLAKSSVLKDIFNKSGDDNLRNLRFVLQEFERLVLTLELIERLRDDFLESTLICLMIFSLEYRSGRLKEGDIAKYTSNDYWFVKAFDGNEGSDKRDESPFEKYQTPDLSNLIFTSADWEDFCFHGRINRSNMVVSIVQYDRAKEKSWRKLWQYEMLDEIGFQENLTDMQKNLEEGDWSHPLEIMHAVMLLYHFKVMKALSSEFTERSIRRLGLTSLSRFLERPDFDHRIDGNDIRSSAFAGLGFYCGETRFYHSFSKKFIDVAEEKYLAISKRHISELPNKLQELNGTDLASYLSEFNALNPGVIRFPVFAEFSFEALAKSLIHIAGEQNLRPIVKWFTDIMDATHRDYNDVNIESLGILNQEIVTELSSASIGPLGRMKLNNFVKWIRGIIQKHTDKNERADL